MNRFARFALMAMAIRFAAPAPAASAQTAGKPTIAIMAFHNTTLGKDAREYDGLAKGVPDFLVREMAGNPNIRVVERDQVQHLIDEQKLVAGGQISQETAVRAGRLLGAQHVIFGDFMGDQSGNVRIDARAVNVETGQIEHIERVQDRAENVMPLIAQLAARLNAGLHLPPMPSRSGERTPGASPELPMKYAVMYGKALDLADGGDTARAVELFDAVLKALPGFAPAQNGLRNLRPGA